MAPRDQTRLAAIRHRPSNARVRLPNSAALTGIVGDDHCDGTLGLSRGDPGQRTPANQTYDEYSQDNLLGLSEFPN